MRPCDDPTCWPIRHTRADHLEPGPDVVRWLVAQGLWSPITPEPAPVPQEASR